MSIVRRIRRGNEEYPNSQKIAKRSVHVPGVMRRNKQLLFMSEEKRAEYITLKEKRFGKRFTEFLKKEQEKSAKIQLDKELKKEKESKWYNKLKKKIF